MLVPKADSPLAPGHLRPLLSVGARCPGQLTQRLEQLVEILAAAHLPGAGEVGHGGSGGGGGKAAESLLIFELESNYESSVRGDKYQE